MNISRAALHPFMLAASATIAGCLAASSPIGRTFAPDRDAEFLTQDHAALVAARTSNVVATLSSRFAPQGVYLTAYPGLQRGPDGARAWLAQDTLNARSTTQWTVLRHGFSADGRDAYSYGYMDVLHPAGDTLLGRYQAYWRRTESGTWQLLAFSRGRRAPGAISLNFPPEIAARSPKQVGAMPLVDTIAVLRAVFATEAAFCDSAAVNVGAAFAGFAAPDVGKLQSGSEYVFGPEGVARLFAGAPTGSLGPVWKPETGSVAASGDLAFTLGPAWARQAGPVQTQPSTSGRYFTIWKRQPDGRWRYVVD